MQATLGNFDIISVIAGHEERVLAHRADPDLVTYWLLSY